MGKVIKKVKDLYVYLMSYKYHLQGYKGAMSHKDAMSLEGGCRRKSGKEPSGHTKKGHRSIKYQRSIRKGETEAQTGHMVYLTLLTQTGIYRQSQHC